MADRIYSIDSMRLIAMLFVVAIHTDPFRGLGTYGNLANFVIDSSGRVAVPFFFVTSGYFFASKTANRDPADYFSRQATSIASLYVFGLLLAAPVFFAGRVLRSDVRSGALATEIVREVAGYASPLELLYYGTSVSVVLWFLPALLFSLAFVYGFDRFNRGAYAVPISLGFHGIGLLGASYTMFVDVPFEIRDALFFGFFYTSIGYYVFGRERRPDPERSWIYLAATGVFAALHVGERYALGYALTGDTFAQGVYTASYTIGTALVAVSLFAFLLSRPELGRDTPLPYWGQRYAAGIYVAHPAVLYPLERVPEVLEPIGYAVGDTLLWHLALTPATFLGAALVYVVTLELGVIEQRRIKLPRVGALRKPGHE